jgi:replication factor C small subunit
LKELWVEKYRPKTVDGYVFRDDAQRNQVETWIKDKAIPHLLLSGNAGIGKTTLAKLLFNELEIDDFNILEINASRTNSVDDVRDKIVNFVQMMAFGDDEFRVVLLDEADYLSPNAQAALRGVMEEYHSTARFVLTCNYPNRIIPAIHSRCQSFHIAQLPQDAFLVRLGQILQKESVIVEDISTLDTYVKATYPDLRKCINMVQQNVVDKKLLSPSANDSGVSDWKLEMVELFKAGKIQEARKLLCGTIRAEEMEDVYRWLYDNVDLFSDPDEAVLKIKQGMVDHTLVVDPEINLAATLIRLARLQ